MDPNQTMQRSYSEGDIFCNSWDYTNVDKNTGMNGVALVLKFLHAEKPESTVIINHTPEKKTNKKKIKKTITDVENVSQVDNFYITPRQVNLEITDENEVIFKTNSEGRKIIEAASLDQLVRIFSEESQGIYNSFDKLD